MGYVDTFTNAPIEAYLVVAEKYYQQDNLDAAMAVVSDAFQQRSRNQREHRYQVLNRIGLRR